MIRVTVEDLETGDKDTADIDNDYMLVTAGSVYLAHTQAFANGTHVLTVKRRCETAASLCGVEGCIRLELHATDHWFPSSQDAKTTKARGA